MKKNGLPPYIDQFFDRHGGLRTRFRRKGRATVYIKSIFPSREFWEEYDALVNGEPRPAGIERAAPGSIGELMGRFFAVPSRLGPTPDTQYRNRRILEEVRTVHGFRMVHDATFEDIDIIVGTKAETAPWQARKLRRLLKKLFAFAVRAKMIDTNPVDESETVQATTEGYHTWTESEIDQFVKRHPKGTKPYLAMMLMLWTFQRRSDAVRMRIGDLKDGWIPVRQQKMRVDLAIPIAPQLAEAIAAMPAPADLTEETTFLRTEYGRPFTAKGFGNWFRTRCDEADLPQCSAHGLRKAASRRAAQIGLSNQSIKSVTGHKTDSEVARYTRSVEQGKLAEAAMAAMSAWYVSNPEERLDK